MKWIKTSERLPEVGVWVLVAVNGGRITIALLDWEDPSPDGGYKPFKYWSDLEDGALELVDVTHWMPLPDAPGQEQ